MSEPNEDEFDYNTVVVTDGSRLISIASQIVTLSRKVQVHHDGVDKHLRGVVFDTDGVKCVLGNGSGASNVEVPMVECMDLRECRND